MSSTTSSDCESCDCSQCTYSFENNHNDYGKLLLNSRHVPMYATMAHPLIYYAEIQQPVNRRQICDQPGKDNPFKKAFKWYTQERTLCNKTDVSPERSGFANWLDNKYVEYLRECGQQMKAPTSHEPRAPKTSTPESCPQCPGMTKKFGRFKSPWRKRRRSGNDSGDVPKKCPDGSCEFLLKPKELTRAASEPSYHTPTSGCKSISTVASSNIPSNTKCSGRSHSLSDVAHEKSALKHGDTVPHAVQESPNYQEQAPTKLATTSSSCHQKQGRTKLPKSMCICPQNQGPSKEQDATNQPRSLCKCPQEQVVKVLSKEQDASNQVGPLCNCLQEKVAEVVKVPSKGQDATNQPRSLCKCPQEQVVKVLSKEQNAPNQVGLYCKRPQEEAPEIVKVPPKEQDATNQAGKRPKEEAPEIVKVPSKEQDATNQAGLCCKRPQEKAPEIVKVPPKEQDSTNQAGLCCKRPQEEAPEIVEVPPKEQDATNQARLCCKRPQEETPEIVKVPSKATNQAGLCCKNLQEKVPEIGQAPTKQQDPTNQPKPLQGKEPKVVQVPSQSRAVEESCQYPEEKVVPVHEETQYEPAPEPPRSSQNHGPCCCKTCNKPIAPSPQMICIPVKVQSNKVTSPEMCLTISPLIDAPKKQKAKQLNVSCQSGEGNKSKVDTQSQHQPELSACCKDTAAAASPNNSHEVNQEFVSIPLRRQSYSTVSTTINEETGEYRIVKEVAVVNKFTRSVTCASNDAAQTSDHSILFEKEPCSCQYPLFFKIICADISKNE